MFKYRRLRMLVEAAWPVISGLNDLCSSLAGGLSRFLEAVDPGWPRTAMDHRGDSLSPSRVFGFLQNRLTTNLWHFARESWVPCWTSVPPANMAIELLEQRQMLTAAPLATLTILARNDANPDDPYTSSLNVTAGEVVSYEILINAQVSHGDTYSNASLPITNATIGSGDGINSLPSFSLLQTAADGVNLTFDNADYDAAASPTLG